jgi:hypothetical protein
MGEKVFGEIPAAIAVAYHPVAREGSGVTCLYCTSM